MVHRTGEGALGRGAARDASADDSDAAAFPELSERELGFLIGVLVGEGHFGGDGRQPHVTLRMHVRHAGLFAWLARTVGGRLYGPYDHGGRRYYQWMARGVFLRERLLPLLEAGLDPARDRSAWERYVAMKRDYGLDEAD